MRPYAAEAVTKNRMSGFCDFFSIAQRSHRNSDQIVDLCEIKYSEAPYQLDREEYENICRRIEIVLRESGVRKAIQTVLIAANGVAPGKYRGHIQREVAGDDLFG